MLTRIVHDAQDKEGLRFIYIYTGNVRLSIGYTKWHVYEEYKRRYTPLDGLPEAIAEGKQPSGVYRVYTPSRRGISGLYNI